MPIPIEQLRSEARALDADQRARLVLDLLESLDDGASTDRAEAALNAEARERLAQYDAGETTTMSSEDSHASLGVSRR